VINSNFTLMSLTAYGWNSKGQSMPSGVYCAVLLAFALAGDSAAQGTTKFTARLSRAAIDASELSKVAGLGSLEAELKGNTLTIQGKFSGLLSAATKAHLDRGAEKGLRGRLMFDLIVSPGTAGTISGTVTLSTSQVNDLRLGRFYVQIDSEKAPDGNLWGWILPQEPR
jgi:hypothetical protein